MLSERENRILSLLQEGKAATSGEILAALNGASLATVKRDLARLVAANLVVSSGKGRGTKYAVSRAYRLLGPVDIEAYYAKEADERQINRLFNWELLREALPKTKLFTSDESARLNALQRTFSEHLSTLGPAGYRKEMERLAIDLSWKSSQIEGNTYSLLETERLLKEKQTASGKTKEEATMLLNHKAAIDFIVANPDFVKPLTVAAIEDIHALLVKELDVERNVRTRRVGISGTNYQPLDNEFQIHEALTATCDLIGARQDAFEQALLGLALISYIQPFMDGNKRTARIMANALLLANGCCPLSFRTVDSVDYKKAMLIFYEQNNISTFKRIFVEQYEFAVNTYF
ncbi:MAG: Fic family protein [Azoarcus sp.]|jgi:Fic family protein|nr:Fic family protein [Azoarcus sp.]